MKRITTLSCLLGFTAAICTSTRVEAGPIMWQSTIAGAGPTVWYQFNETTGTTTADVAGTPENGTYYNQNTANDTTGVTLGVAGAVGNAVTFDGTRGFVRATNVPLGQSFTVETIARSEPVDGNWDAYGGLGASAGANGFILHPYPFGHNVQGYVRTSSGPFDFSAAASLTPADVHNAFHLYVLTYDNSTGQLKLYIDGTSNLATFGTIPIRTAGTTGTVDIAHDQASALTVDDRLSNISVDEWVFYDRVLSAAEVANHLAVITAVPEPSSFVLIGMGTIGLMAARRRNRRVA